MHPIDNLFFQHDFRPVSFLKKKRANSPLFQQTNSLQTNYTTILSAMQAKIYSKRDESSFHIIKFLFGNQKVNPVVERDRFE
jgi:hypothetical protein